MTFKKINLSIIISMFIIVSCREVTQNLSPRQTVEKVLQAINDGDSLITEQFLDIESVIGNAFTSVKVEKMNIQVMEADIFASFLFGGNVIDRIWKQSKRLSRIYFEELLKNKGDIREFKRLYYEVIEVSYERELIDIASVGIRLKNKLDNTIDELEVRLKKHNGYWRIVELNNASQFMKRIAKEEKRKKEEDEKQRKVKQQKAYLSKLNKAFQSFKKNYKALNRKVGTFQFNVFMKKADKDDWHESSFITIQSKRKIKKNIKSILFRVYCDSWGGTIKTYVYDIKPQEIKGNKKISTSYSLSDIGNIKEDCSYPVEIVSYTLKNGRSINLITDVKKLEKITGEKGLSTEHLSKLLKRKF